MSDELQQSVETPVDTAPADATPPVQLQLQDLMLAAQVIQLVTQRGAFKAEEMEQVGGLYNRLVTFLQASGVLTPASTATTETAEPAAE